MKKVVLKLAMADDKDKKKAMKIVSGIEGVDSVAIDMKDKKLTVTGEIDPVTLVSKLRKICMTDIVSVGPAKEEQKKKDEPKKDEPKKEAAAGDNKKKDNKDNQETKVFPMSLPYYPPPPPPHYYTQVPYYNRSVPNYYNRSVEEDPNGCVIC